MRAWLLDLYRLIRFSALGATLVLPLLGAASVRRTSDLAILGGLLGGALLFHAFAYILNDVIDLEIDRRSALRQPYPLVRGALSRRSGLGLALGLLLPLLGLAATSSGGIWLLAAIMLMSVYNLWGKRCPIPPLTDAAQGLGWAALLLWGAGGELAALTGWLALHEIALIMLVNGVHGGLRDLESDLAGGACTTAIWLGARLHPSGGVQLGGRMLAYALGWQLAILGLLAAGLSSVWAEYSAAQRLISGGGMLALALGLLWAAGKARRVGDRDGNIALGMLHLIAALSAPLLLVAPLLPPLPLLLLLLCHSIPLLLNGMTYDALRWLARVPVGAEAR